MLAMREGPTVLLTVYPWLAEYVTKYVVYLSRYLVYICTCVHRCRTTLTAPLDDDEADQSYLLVHTYYVPQGKYLLKYLYLGTTLCPLFALVYAVV